MDTFIICLSSILADVILKAVRDYLGDESAYAVSELYIQFDDLFLLPPPTQAIT